MVDILSQLAKTKSSLSLLRREFKIAGLISEPGQTEKLTFVSLMHQIDSGLKRDYQENEIVDAVIRAISPHSSLRSYVETLSDLSLAKDPSCTLQRENRVRSISATGNRMPTK